MTIPALYLHIPFCISRCAYCDFVSSEYSTGRASAYLDALDMLCDRHTQDLQPQTIYIGGGTPTCLELDQLEHLNDILMKIDRSNLREMSIEANPGTVNVEKALIIKKMGITRVSLGAQTFSPKGLQTLGRIHNERQTKAAMACLREAGIDNISLDLIYGWPDQTADLWEHDLQTALSLKPSHLSVYGLTYEEDTPLANAVQDGRYYPVSEELDRLMFDMAGGVLKDAGYQRYEISNYAKPGKDCKHNISYWTGDEYLGIGAGAYSYVDQCRFGMEEDVDRFTDLALGGQDPVVERETLTPEHRARECGVIWLRMMQGIDLEAFCTKTGLSVNEIWPEVLPVLVDDGWLNYSEDHRHLCLAEKALPIADSVLSELV